MAAQRAASLVSLTASTDASNPTTLADVGSSAFIRQTVLSDSLIQPGASVLRPSVTSTSLSQRGSGVLPSKLTAGALAMMAPVLSGFDGTLTFGQTLIGSGAALTGGVVVAVGTHLIQNFRAARLTKRHFPEESALYWRKDIHDEWVGSPLWELQILKKAVWLVEGVVKLSPEKQRAEIDRLVHEWDHQYYDGAPNYRFHLEQGPLAIALKRLSELVPESFARNHLFLFQAMLAATWQRYTVVITTIVTNLERVHPSRRGFES